MADRRITQIAALPKPATIKAAAKAIQRVAAYARVSTDHEDQESSLAAQTDYYKTKILEHPGWEFVQIYVDDGISGLTTNRRAGFNQMIADCLDGHIDLVLTKSISRFARNTVDTVTTIRKLKEKGVAVYFEKENIFTSDSKGEFLLTVMSSLAQEESRSISENVTWGKRKQYADGKVSLGYSRFLGYDKGAEKFTMVVNDEEAVTVRRIFFLFLQGYTPHAIAQILMEENVTAPGGGDYWHQQTIRRMIENEKYKGDALLQKEFTVDFLTKKMKRNEGELPQYYVKEDHEPIISPWLFDYVQEQIALRTDLSESKNQRYSGCTPLSSKVICGTCGAYFGPRPWHSTSYNNLAWQCKNRVKAAEKCRTHNVYDTVLHMLIHDCARMLAVERDVLSKVTAQVIKVCGNDRQAEVHSWINDFKKRPSAEMLWDIDDLALIIRSITITQYRRAVFSLLDGEEVVLPLPEYSPLGHPSYDAETKRLINEMRTEGIPIDAIADKLALDISRLYRYCGIKEPRPISTPKPQKKKTGNKPEKAAEEKKPGKNEVITAAIKDSEGGSSYLTEMQKSAIRYLRLERLGYGKIAEKLMLNKETVKSFCRRNGLGSEDLEKLIEEQTQPEKITGMVLCQCCRKEIPQIAGRKKKKFCSDSCRNKWWNSHQDMVEKKAFYDIECRGCGAMFRTYGNSHRKYCCHECYIKDRFGKKY